VNLRLVDCKTLEFTLLFDHYEQWSLFQMSIDVTIDSLMRSDSEAVLLIRIKFLMTTIIDHFVQSRSDQLKPIFSLLH
jgi:hypothetical protein